MTSTIIVIVIKNADWIKNDGIAVGSEKNMMEIEWLINNGMVLRNIHDANPLRQNDDWCC